VDRFSSHSLLQPVIGSKSFNMDDLNVIRTCLILAC
jgi:hypothetical protein